MNIDKGNQASEGEGVINLGTLANPNIDLDTFTGEEYALMTLTSEGRSFEVVRDDQGMVWLIAGTDSGFRRPHRCFQQPHRRPSERYRSAINPCN